MPRRVPKRLQKKYGIMAGPLKQLNDNGATVNERARAPIKFLRTRVPGGGTFADAAGINVKNPGKYKKPKL